MTPKEKAEELISKYYFINGPFTEAKQCALVAIDEILQALEYNTWQNSTILKYYEDVKKEIENL